MSAMKRFAEDVSVSMGLGGEINADVLHEASRRLKEPAGDVELLSFTDGTRAILTTDSPASRYGELVLRHEGCDCCECEGDLYPTQPLPSCMGDSHAGRVGDWVHIAIGFTTDPHVIEAANKFLAQAPQAVWGNHEE